jgi:hypothetical protein
MITIQVEPFNSYFPEARVLAQEHVDEVWEGNYNPDETTLEFMALHDLIHTLCVRDNDKLVGYSMISLTKDPSDITSLISQSLYLYVQKAYRGRTSLSLLKATEELAIALGAAWHVWNVHPKNDFSRYIIKKGYKLRETMYMKFIGSS